MKDSESELGVLISTLGAVQTDRAPPSGSKSSVHLRVLQLVQVRFSRIYALQPSDLDSRRIKASLSKENKASKYYKKKRKGAPVLQLITSVTQLAILTLPAFPFQ